MHVAEGRYASVSDMVRAALRLLLDAEEAKVARPDSVNVQRQASRIVTLAQAPSEQAEKVRLASLDSYGILDTSRRGGVR